jgi:hypothetical protein
MKIFIVRSLEVVSYIGFFGFILAGALATYFQTMTPGGGGGDQIAPSTQTVQ